MTGVDAQRNSQRCGIHQGNKLGSGRTVRRQRVFRGGLPCTPQRARCIPRGVIGPRSDDPGNLPIAPEQPLVTGASVEPRSEDRGEVFLKRLCVKKIPSIPRSHCKVYDIDAVLDSTDIDKYREYSFAL